MNQSDKKRDIYDKMSPLDLNIRMSCKYSLTNETPNYFISISFIMYPKIVNENMPSLPLFSIINHFLYNIGVGYTCNNSSFNKIYLNNNSFKLFLYMLHIFI